MKTYKKRKQSMKAFIILFLLFFTMVGVVAAWSIGHSEEKLPSITEHSFDNPVKLSPPSSQTQKYKIMIDPGHGGKDPGATGVSGNYERDYTLALAKKVFDLLRDEPMFETRMTRTTDVFVELEDRAAMANEWQADALLSIHGNTYTDDSANGTETLYTHDDSNLLAQTVQKNVIEALGFRDRGVKEEQLKVLSLSEMPAALVEVGYLTNAGEEAVMLSGDGQNAAAKGIVEGLKQYFLQYGEHPSNLEGLQIDGQEEHNDEEHSNVDASSIINKKVYYNGLAADGKRVALTFDDGPDTEITSDILVILKENEIKATFFIVGKQAKAHPEMVKRIVKEGHVIANHSWSHPNFNKLTIEESLKQIKDTQDQLEAISGLRPLLFRPPYGELNEERVKAVHELNMAVVNWSVDTMDWSGITAPAILKIVNKQVYSGGIVLQHSTSGRGNTVEALELMIPQLREKGYTFVTVPEMLNLPDYQDA
ncbi:N-acetylmuramoyl-L-alanine amidase/peptidoglycan/xylan/chitin deacetylase (PgdA/CDA1 family) [Paenibacillus endophyticus]|uniref:N-acetylmuramoyl-L-alanine amidase/peptidoglycan/xylan/chitin deacetylase (PgdA/CDA1 family) n=1 Tax=Paenibacillus endophyticus TaxID=1294268 RepID=A0A7W5C8Y1_9BACL|nr:N-acetylmuramoyl-L-alanine amidase [Paenibacillus endophyticus]MBB3153253.1 N-acetylmuramoyl-L-alanine amidase/peptidoglycan/xylan/chitin deacetylase (PgdA/CDA1 family) [Paenibacillus endophyticus]